MPPEYNFDYPSDPSCSEFVIDRYEPLLENMDDVTKRDDEGRTVLHVLAFHGCSDIIPRIIENKATVIDARDNQGRTPLYMAAEEGNEQVVGMLLNYGANPNIKTTEGVTATEAAEQNDHRRVMRLLQTVELFLNPTIKPNSDKTLLYFAVDKGHRMLVRSLLIYFDRVASDIVDLAKRKGDEKILKSLSKLNP